MRLGTVEAVVTVLKLRMSDPSLQTQYGRVQAGGAGRPDFAETRGQRLRLLRLKDAECRAGPLEMKPVQIMLAVDNNQGVRRDLAFRPGLENRHGMAIGAQQPEHSRARSLEIARVVHDDVEPPPAHVAQKRGEALGAPRAVPA